jgi:hypothetical protein
MKNVQEMSIIAELPDSMSHHGYSKFAIFLDGDSTNTDQENIIDQGYFDNCYSFEQFMEDVLIIDSLRLEQEKLQVELQKAQTLIANLQSDQGKRQQMPHKFFGL